MKRIFSALVLLLFIIISSCKAPQSTLSVYNINNLQDYKPTSIIYGLPKTKVFITVEIEKIIKNKGPYSEYTEKYFGALKNTVRENKTKYRISKISLYSLPICDTSNIYVISNTNEDLQYGINQSKDGFLLSVNMPGTNNYTQSLQPSSNYLNKQNYSSTNFNNLSSDKNYKIIYDTIYKEEVYDTIIRKVPILKKNVIMKTKEEQAKDLADQILTLHDDKQALLVGEGDSEYLPDGKALRIMLDNITSLEAEYLSMFIGKIDTLKHYYTYSYEPNNNDYKKKKIIFKFSEISGILPADNLYGTPVYIELETNNYWEKIDNFQQNQNLFKQINKKQTNAGLYYRIPQRADLRILYNTQKIAEKSMYIAQLGKIGSLPSNIFNKKIKIEFYPELGAIKTIDIEN